MIITLFNQNKNEGQAEDVFHRKHCSVHAYAHLYFAYFNENAHRCIFIARIHIQSTSCVDDNYSCTLQEMLNVTYLKVRSLNRGQYA